jgi:hypothetical protein
MHFQDEHTFAVRGSNSCLFRLFVGFFSSLTWLVLVENRVFLACFGVGV